MSANAHNFIEWKEHFVSQERGSRVVHYFLKDSLGDSYLAVVGTERSLRHMVYVVSDEFLGVTGLEKLTNSCFKWKSRREVVIWLTSLLSKKHCSQDYSKSPTNDSTQTADHSVSEWNNQGNYKKSHMSHFARNLKDHNLDIAWSGTAWTCGKQLTHYQAFCRSGTTIPIHSFVLVMAKEGNHYLAYLDDIYENKKGQKKVKVRWFHQSEEVIGIIPPPKPHPREVFITPYAQVISVECVDGLATVLTLEHYEKCLAALPSSSTSTIHLCYRQFHSNRVKPFNLCKLQGYFDQMIFSCLDEEFGCGRNMKRGSKNVKSFRGHPRFTTSQSGVRISGSGDQIVTCGAAYQNLKFELSGRKPLAVKYIGPYHCDPLPFKVDEKIELLCQDSGIRGCWFRCTVLEISRKRLKVHYDDVESEDGCGNLEEWIPAFRPAAPDKLGMRCLGRLTIRPCPPTEKLTDVVFEIGTPVDAWWNDGWWEGVVTRVNNCGDDGLQVYFPGENVFSIIQRRDLRISRDWISNQWVNIETKQDILSSISAVRPCAKFSACSTIAKGAESGGSAEVPTNSELDSVEDDKQAIAGLDEGNGLPENVNVVNFRKRKWNQDEVGKVNDGDDAQNDNGSDEKDAKLVMNKEGL
ncbi:agenet and bromo-adjacent homology (BAH) domain-containing protein [Tasmannia lanceolata]|uniref:agenet and bromo-adjacent homology (BAH) domain-containing protein n=1 Tax=Tasmannia lanceolata TaxID=3420 RepID=UPI0040647961